MKTRKNKINLDTLLNCFEFIVDKDFEFNFNRENLISYFYSFTVCKMFDKRQEVLDKLLLDLADENIIYFIKAVSTLSDSFLHEYCFWLVRHLINVKSGLSPITFQNFDFANIVRLNKGALSFDANKIYYQESNNNLSVDLSFLNKRLNLEPFFEVANCFHIGRILRRKTVENLVDDYPHYFQLILESNPALTLYAVRASVNGNFLISKNIVSFF